MGYYLTWAKNPDPNPDQYPGECVAKWRYDAVSPPGPDWQQATPAEMDAYMESVHNPAMAAWKANPPEYVRTPSSEEVWREKLAGTWTDPITGLTFDCSLESRTTIASYVVHLREKIDLKQITDETEVYIDPKEGMRLMKCRDARLLFDRYGKSCGTGTSQSNVNILISLLMKACLLFTFLSITCFSADYYVSKTGSDVTGDGSENSPYLTVQKALNVGTSAGSIIHVGQGTFDERPDTKASGTSSSPITVIGVGTNSTIIGGLNIKHDYINLLNCQVSGSATTTYDYAVKLQRTAHYCLISSNYFYNTPTSVYQKFTNLRW